MYYYAIDWIGRTWKVEGQFVKNDYIEYLMQEDNISREDAIEFLEEAQSSVSICLIDRWWYEKILPCPCTVMRLGTMVHDITDEKKNNILDDIAKKEMLDLGKLEQWDLE